MERRIKQNFEELKGKVLTSIIGDVGDDEMFFITNEGERYKLHHEPD